jgi:hypothetical protein
MSRLRPEGAPAGTESAAASNALRNATRRDRSDRAPLRIGKSFALTPSVVLDVHGVHTDPESRACLARALCALGILLLLPGAATRTEATSLPPARDVSRAPLSLRMTEEPFSAPLTPAPPRRILGWFRTSAAPPSTQEPPAPRPSKLGAPPVLIASLALHDERAVARRSVIADPAKPATPRLDVWHPGRTMPVGPAHGAERPPPGRSRTLAVPETRIAPVLDGALDEPAWKAAAVASGFWISEQERWPAEQTEVLVMADREYLYFGFRVYDSHPDAIQTLQTRRGAGLGLDDQVAVELDPFLSHREISTYKVSASGVQDDAIAGGRARQLEWKGRWHAAARRTAYGWSAEIAIPFGILNYEPGTTAMGVNFLRHHHRTGEWSRWADITPRALPTEMGKLTGLELPAVARTQPWTLMPYVLVGRNIPDRRGEVRATLADAGGEIRYQPRPNLTGVVSLNPDFSQVEAAITNINFNYNERFRPDPRPFFQEGSAYFGDTESYFYSNRIPDFDYGGKVFTRASGYQFGALATRAPDNRSDLVLRLQRELDPTHSVGAMLVGTDRPDLRNALYVVRGQGKQASGLHYAMDLAMTSTSGAAGDGTKLHGTLGWARDYWSIGVNADRYTVNYRPMNALLPADLPDTRGVAGFAGYYRDFGDAPIRAFKGDVSWSTRNTGDGQLQRRFWTGGGSIEARQQVRLGLWYTDGLYRPLASAPGVWSDTLNDDRYWTAALDMNTRSSRLGYGLTYSSGFLGGGDYRYLMGYGWVRPTATTFVNATSERLTSFGVFNQTVVSAGWDISSRQGLVGRFITADHGEAYRLAYSLHVRRNADFFLVYDHEPDQSARFSAKLVMTFQ